MAFNTPSPSPGPGWTALPEPVDSSAPSSEAEREEIDFTPPNTQRPQKSPAKKKKVKDGGVRSGGLFRQPAESASSSGSRQPGTSAASSSSSGSGLGGVSSSQMPGSPSSRGGMGGSRSAADAEANSERMRQLERVMSGGRTNQSRDVPEDVRRPASKISEPEIGVTSVASSTQGRSSGSVSEGSRLQNASNAPNDSASAAGPSRPSSQTTWKGKPPTLLKRMSDSAARARTLSHATNATPLNAGLEFDSTRSVIRPSQTLPSFPSARPQTPKKTVNADADVIYISSSSDESSHGANKTAKVAKPGSSQTRLKAARPKQPQSNVNPGPSSSAREKEPLTPTKQKEPVNPPRPIQTARKVTGGKMPLKWSIPPRSDSDDNFPTGVQLSQQVREEKSASVDKGKGKATPRQIREQSTGKKNTSAVAGPSKSSSKKPDFAVPGRPASASISSSTQSSSSNKGKSALFTSGKVTSGKKPDAHNRRHTISAGDVIDLSEEPEEPRPTQNRRTSLQNTADLRVGNKDDPLVLDDSGDESPPNEIPIVPTMKKKTKRPQLLVRKLPSAFKPLEKAQAMSAAKRNASGGEQGQNELINLLSSDEEDVRSSNKKNNDRPTSSSATPAAPHVSTPSKVAASDSGPSAMNSTPATGDVELNFESMDDDMGVPFDDSLPGPDVDDPPLTPNDNLEMDRDSVPTSGQPTPTPATLPLPCTFQEANDVPMHSREASPVPIQRPEVLPTTFSDVVQPPASEILMPPEEDSTMMNLDQPTIHGPAVVTNNRPTNVASDDFQSSIDGDAAEVDALLDTVVNSQRSTPFEGLDSGHVEEQRPVAPTLASELDNMSLQKSGESSSISLATVAPAERPSTPDESAIPLASIPITPKSPATPKTVPFVMKDVAPLKASPGRAPGVANPAAYAPSPAQSSPPKPSGQRTRPPPFNFFKDAVRKKDAVDEQPSGSKDAGNNPVPVKIDSQRIPKAPSGLQNRTGSEGSGIPSPTPTKSLLLAAKDKTPESTPSKIPSSSAIFQESLLKLAPLEALVPTPQPRRDIKTAGNSTSAKASSAAISPTETPLGTKQAALLGQVIRKNAALRRGSSAVLNLDSIRSAHAESRLRQSSSQEKRQDNVHEGIMLSSASKAEKHVATSTTTTSIVENKLSDELQTLDIVEHEEIKQRGPASHDAVTESTGLKRTRSMSTLDSDTTSSDDPLKPHSYDMKLQRAAKRPRLTSTKMEEVQRRERLAVKSASFKPPVQKKPSPPSSGRSSSSISQSDDDRDIALPSPTTSTEDPMDLLGDNNDIGGSGNNVTSPVSSVTNGLRQISVSPKDVAQIVPKPFYGRNYRLAKDIPTDLHDQINSMDQEQRDRMWNTLRTVFEAQMYTNTVEDEPDAPRIQIINDIDDDPTPPFEFYYTNLMWHDEGVPPPDYEGLRGCDCVGGCNPESKTCACVKRQRTQFKDEDADPHRWLPNGFMYNERGILVQTNFPIIECNDACRCSDECMNRVVQRGRKCVVNIVKTKKKGWGVFAGQKIPKGTFIGIYSGELLTEDESEKRGLEYNKAGRTYLFDIDCWHIGASSYTIDAFHAGNFTRFLNHSCDPACSVSFVYHNDADLAKPLFALFTKRDVAKNEELTFSYLGEDIDDDDEDLENVMQRQKPLVKEDKVYDVCYCGSKNCRGKLFKYR